MDPFDTEQIGRIFTILLTDPIAALGSVLIPFIGAVISGYVPIQKKNIAQQSRLAESVKNSVYNEVNKLKACAGITREINVYTGSIQSFHSYGSSIVSILPPLVAIPQQCLTRPKEPNSNIPDFGSEIPSVHKLKENTWLFSDDETRYFISRELSLIKHSGAILRVLLKVSLVVTAVAMYFGPFGILAGLGIAIGAIGIYIIFERCFQARIDIAGTKILGAMYKDEKLATTIAIDALKKIQKQNKIRREESWVTRLYVMKSGNNFLDITAPLLTNRIIRLEKHLKKLENTTSGAL